MTRRESQGDEAEGVEEWLEGFRWPLPRAFASAVASHRFEQGDVLYRTRSAYEALQGEDAFAGGGERGRVIQVLEPARSVRSGSGDGEGDRRSGSWQSEVVVESIDLARGTREVRRSSQGRLVMALWQGDEGWLDPAREDPPLPRGARELQGRLDQARGAIAEAVGGWGGARFTFVVDLVNDASRAKAHAVEEALRAAGRVERVDLRPDRAGIEEPERYHPSLVVRCLVAPDRDVDALQGLLRDCLYGGGRGTSPVGDDETGSSGSDRFSVARHGVLETNEP